jgi:hypothetical protein
MIHTFVAYGFQLGGPSNWALDGMAAGDRLITPWFDETDPTHDLAACATDTIANGLGIWWPGRHRRAAHDAQTPIMFLTTIEVSPPGWTREASAPPTLGWQLPPVELDRPAPASYVLIVIDSVTHLEAQEAAFYDEDSGDGDEILAYDMRVDWDSLLNGALTELGLQMPGMPDWFWYRTETLD